MKLKDFKKVCMAMHDICWIIAEDEDVSESTRKNVLKMAEIFYRMKLKSRS